MKLLHGYLAAGGMPGVVRETVETHSLRHIRQIQSDLNQSYHDDFVKYARKHQIRPLGIILKAVPLQLGPKFTDSRVGAGLRSRELIQAIDLLEKACINPHFFKVLFLDIGLARNIMGLDIETRITGGLAKPIKGGPVTEAIVGQELIALSDASPASPPG